MIVRAVIGANFGDEGKGRIVDHFAANAKGSVVVVRYNGGAQAGHTVVLPDGRSHVFCHYGSGTLAGAATFLSEFFIINPLLWKKERIALDQLGVNPELRIHPDAPLTTPWDMLINREVETHRGNGRHGSCGYGINETVERLTTSKLRIFMRDLGTPVFKDTLKAIKTEWVPQRLGALGIDKPSESFEEFRDSPDLLGEYMEATAEMNRHSRPMFSTKLKQWDNVIFEGAQGLCLDERSRFFPHVTRSRTGLANVVEICGQMGADRIAATYVTRAYLTRHGAGPLPNELDFLTYDDATNGENPWQGRLRFAPLNLDLLAEMIRKDLGGFKGVRVTPSVAMTCMDQVGDEFDVWMGGKFSRMSPAALQEAIGQIVPGKLYVSRTRHRT